MAKPNDILAIVVILLAIVVGAASIFMCRLVRIAQKDAALMSSSSSSSIEIHDASSGSTILPGVPAPQGMWRPPGAAGYRSVAAGAHHGRGHGPPIRPPGYQQHAAAHGHHGAGRVPPMRPPGFQQHAAAHGHYGAASRCPPMRPPGFLGMPGPQGVQGRPAMVDIVEGGRPKKDKGKKSKKTLGFFSGAKPLKKRGRRKRVYSEQWIEARDMRPVRQEVPGTIHDRPRNPPPSVSSS